MNGLNLDFFPFGWKFVCQSHCKRLYSNQNIELWWIKELAMSLLWAFFNIQTYFLYSELSIYGRRLSVNCVIRKCNNNYQFQSPCRAVKETGNDPKERLQLSPFCFHTFSCCLLQLSFHIYLQYLYSLSVRTMNNRHIGFQIKRWLLHVTWYDPTLKQRSREVRNFIKTLSHPIPF